MTDDPAAVQFFVEIGIIDQLARTMLERTLPKPMTLAQFSILNHFVRLEPGETSPAQLASAFQVTRATMTSTLDKLARRQLIEIRPDPADGRAKLVSITADGRQMRAVCISSIGYLLPQLDSIVGQEELERVLPLLSRVRAGLDALR